VALPLRDGVYEQLITTLLHGQLAAIAPSLSEIAKVEPADLSGWLTRHLAAEIQRALKSAGKPEAQIALAHHLLELRGLSSRERRQAPPRRPAPVGVGEIDRGRVGCLRDDLFLGLGFLDVVGYPAARRSYHLSAELWW
jgi:hypothetical protein